MTDTLNVFQALSKARADFQKKGDFKKIKSDTLKFPYLPIESAKPIIEECTAEYGVTIIPTSAEVTDKSTDKNGWNYFLGTVHIDIFGPSGDIIGMDVLAEAKDSSDKCINKLYTCAYKNMAKIVFGFAESPKDDPDATQVDNPTESTPTKRDVPKDDPFFNGGKKTEEKKTEPKTVTLDKAERQKILDEIAIITKRSQTADFIARSYLGKKNAYFQLDDATIVEIVTTIRGV